jgi:hypothetical protein
MKPCVLLLAAAHAALCAQQLLHQLLAAAGPRPGRVVELVLAELLDEHQAAFLQAHTHAVFGCLSLFVPSLGCAMAVQTSACCTSCSITSLGCLMFPVI